MRAAGFATALALTVLSSGCGDLTRQGTGSSYLIIDSLQASSSTTETFASTLNSDVRTNGSVFDDPGRVSLTLAMKNVVDATAPTTNNFITINRYHVRYIRADGRNTEGVDVPYAFDGAVTGTVGESGLTTGFVLVRHVAKAEAPLISLVRNPVIISTIAEVTFYGRDQTGREASVVGQILVSFADFGDPSS